MIPYGYMKINDVVATQSQTICHQQTKVDTDVANINVTIKINI